MKGSIKENIFIIIDAFWHNSCFLGGTDVGGGIDGGDGVGTDGGGGGTDGGGVGTNGGGGVGTYADAIAVEHFLFISVFV